MHGSLEPATQEELDSCPFCEGREDRTPPETLALPAREPPDSPGWRVRVVPNLYPAFERQEVVVHSRDHKRSFAELDDEEVAFVADAWRLRRDAHPEGYLHALVIEQHPTALQLRYLQTLLELGGSQSTTIVFPAPVDLIRPFIERADGKR